MLRPLRRGLGRVQRGRPASAGSDRELGGDAVGRYITDKDESQHIVRVHGTGAFTTLVLPWRKGEKPTGLTVTQDGDAILVKTANAVTRIEPMGYSSTTARGTVKRTLGSRGGSPR